MEGGLQGQVEVVPGILLKLGPKLGPTAAEAGQPNVSAPGVEVVGLSNPCLKLTLVAEEPSHNKGTLFGVARF